MKTWFYASLIALILWGLWGFFMKLASRSVSPKNLIFLGVLGAIMVLPVYYLLFYKEFSFKFTNINYYFAVIGGIFGSLAMIFFYYALHQGEASKVVVLTAMYPVITIILAFLILKEPITLHKILGIIFAILTIYFLST